MDEQEISKTLKEANGRAEAVLRAAAEETKAEQNRRKLLLHTLLDAVLCLGQSRPGLTLTVLDGAAYVTLPTGSAPAKNGGRTAAELAMLLRDFCRATGQPPCPPGC